MTRGEYSRDPGALPPLPQTTTSHTAHRKTQDTMPAAVDNPLALPPHPHPHPQPVRHNQSRGERQRERLQSSPEIQVTRQIINGREVIDLGSDDADEGDDDDGEGPSIVIVSAPRPRSRPRPLPALGGAAGLRGGELADLEARLRAARERNNQEQGRWQRREMLQRIGMAAGERRAVAAARDEEEVAIVPPNQRILSPPPAPHVPAPNAPIIRLGGGLLQHDGHQRLIRSGIQRMFQHIFNPAIFGADPLPADVALAQQQQQQPMPIPVYKSEFTHPEKAKSGFTHSFPPPQPDASSKGKGKGRAIDTPPEVTFICSKCGDKLYLGAPDSARRVFALRCGHLLDGKCVSLLSSPPPFSFPALPFDAPQPITPKPKPKPKPRARRATAKSRSRKKRKLSLPDADKPVHEWTCPVSGCGKVHWSVWEEDGGEEKNGAWVQRREDGGILLYL